MTQATDIALSDLQLDLMRVLWARRRASVAEVVDDLAATRALAHTTVATLLTRLEKRGVVAAERDGRQLLYVPLVEEGAVRRSMVSGLLGSLFGGSAPELLAHLVREQEIAPGDLERVRQLLAASKADPS